jgi:hypothetical protein
MTVSWQVTGVRHDEVAKHLPLVVEEEKRPSERGRYLTPSAFGAPETMRIGSLEAKRVAGD